MSFLFDPDPCRCEVDVAPPYPAKLVDQARSVLDVADDLPPVELVADVTRPRRSGRDQTGARYLLPCRGSGLVLGTQTAYLDERPPDADWVLIGCARSREIHRWFTAGTHRASRCARAGSPGPASACRHSPVLPPRGRGVRAIERCTVVPWGASLTLIKAALADLVSAQEQAWSPG